MTEKNVPDQDGAEDLSSADPSLTRQQFLRRVIKGAALTGGVLASPKILDKFLVPSAYAASSTTCVVAENTLGGIDTVIQSQLNSDLLCIPTGFNTLCVAGTDTSGGYSCP